MINSGSINRNELYPMNQIVQASNKGTVYIAYNKGNINKSSKHGPSTVVIKILYKSETANFIINKDNIEIPSELYFNQLINNSDICPQIYECFNEPDQFSLVMEHLQNNWICLGKLIGGKLKMKSMRQVLYNLIGCLLNLIKCGFLYRDIKPDNFMMNVKDFHVKIIDLEDILYDPDNIDPISSSLVGTLGYFSPEQLKGEQYAVKKSLVFSIGCLLYECLESEILFDSNDEIFKMKKVKFVKSPKLAQDLINQCLIMDIDKRIDIFDIVKHQYFNNLHEIFAL